MTSIPRPQKIAQPIPPLVVVVLGPTASGKTAWGVQLAKKLSGEIISADSRQVYKGMDIGTGKDQATYGRVKVHGLDLVSPKAQYTVAAYQRYAYNTIDDIVSREKLPIIVGGTGLYINAVVHGYQFTQQPNQKKLEAVRARLTKWSLKKLLSELQKIDPQTYAVIDRQNRRRVQRAVEVYLTTGKQKSAADQRQAPPYRFCVIGIEVPKIELYRRIHRRLIERIDNEGMIAEVEQLHRAGVSWKRLDSFGLEYRWISHFLRGQIDFETMLEKLEHDIQQFSKRQLTWFKRDREIHWVDNYRAAEKMLFKKI